MTTVHLEVGFFLGLREGHLIYISSPTGKPPYLFAPVGLLKGDQRKWNEDPLEALSWVELSPS